VFSLKKKLKPLFKERQGLFYKRGKTASNYLLQRNSRILTLYYLYGFLKKRLREFFKNRVIFLIIGSDEMVR
jgi:hypothetical protein